MICTNWKHTGVPDGLCSYIHHVLSAELFSIKFHTKSCRPNYVKPAYTRSLIPSSLKLMQIIPTNSDPFSPIINCVSITKINRLILCREAFTRKPQILEAKRGNLDVNASSTHRHRYSPYGKAAFKN
jgi:hypothetical protein